MKAESLFFGETMLSTPSQARCVGTSASDTTPCWRDGSNLSSVLYGLKKNGNAKLDELFGHIRQVPDEPYREFELVTTQLGDVIFPSRVASLIQAITRSSEERKINVLLSTHNPEVLNALTPEQQQNVVLAFRSKEDYCSRLLPLTQVARYDELLERGQLGDLITRRIVDQHLDPDFENKRNEAMRRWLAGLSE